MDHYLHALSQISVISLVAAALVMMLISTLWYSPLMFGKSWSRHTGIRPHDIRPAEVRRGYVIASLTTLLLSYLLGIISAHATSIFALIASVTLVWVFVMIEQINSFIWERAAFALVLIHALRSLTVLVAGALVHHFLGVL